MVELVSDERSDDPDTLIDCFIAGRPVVPRSPMGRREHQDVWTSTVVDQTMRLPGIHGPCHLEVEFVLPAVRDPWEHPWETSLDHLLKWMLDALEATIHLSDPSSDGEIVAVSARRRIAALEERPGAHLRIRRAEVPAASDSAPARLLPHDASRGRGRTRSRQRGDSELRP